MALIDSNNLILHLVWGGLVDKATCGELKKAIELCTVKDIYTKADMVTTLTELQQKIDDEAWTMENLDASDERIVEMESVNDIIQRKIDDLTKE